MDVRNSGYLPSVHYIKFGHAVVLLRRRQILALEKRTQERVLQHRFGSNWGLLDASGVADLATVLSLQDGQRDSVAIRERTSLRLPLFEQPRLQV